MAHPLATATLALLAIAPLRLALAEPPPALDCPHGTALQGGAPPEAFEAWCEGRPDDAGRPRRHGPARTWYDDGSPWVSESWAEGRRDGPFLERYRSGRPARQGRYRAGEKVGSWSTWYENGQLDERLEWLDGLRQGRFETWFPGGGRRTAGFYCHDTQCGTWITWDETGQELGRAVFGEFKATP